MYGTTIKQYIRKKSLEAHNYPNDVTRNNKICNCVRYTNVHIYFTYTQMERFELVVVWHAGRKCRLKGPCTHTLRVTARCCAWLLCKLLSHAQQQLVTTSCN